MNKRQEKSVLELLMLIFLIPMVVVAVVMVIAAGIVAIPAIVIAFGIYCLFFKSAVPRIPKF